MMMMMTKLCIQKFPVFVIFVIVIFLSEFFLLTSAATAIQQQEERCQCGRFARNRSATTTVAGKLYDTVVPLHGEGFQASIEHAYSHALGRCVALKHCSEQPARLNKCTRELAVFKAFNGSTNAHLIKFYDWEIEHGQICDEKGLWADYLRMIVIGSDRRRKRSETEINNCTEVDTVLELGLQDLASFCKHHRTQCNEVALEQVRQQLQLALDELHGRGVAHRDVHPDNVLVMTHPTTSSNNSHSNNNNLQVKLIDYDWSCCFDRAKCGQDSELNAALPPCERDEALADDEFGLKDIVDEMQKGHFDFNN